MRSFASDNNAGVHPLIMQAMNNANTDHAVGYGDDPWTQEASAKVAALFGEGAEVFFTFNGTGANVMALGAMARPFEGVICSNVAHIHVDECGAPERFGSFKLLDVGSANGKLSPDTVRVALRSIREPHQVRPRVISISQATEFGTVYSLDELKALRALADEYGLLIHMDGARLANSAVALGCTLEEMTSGVGVDVVSFGGTKNGLMAGEAVVILNPALSADFGRIRKQATQLASKMRFISAQFTAYVQDDLWKTCATHANRMARLLSEKAGDVPGLFVSRPVVTNAVFALVPRGAIEPLRSRYPFYVWDESSGEVRWLTSFDTTEEDILGFVEALKEETGKL